MILDFANQDVETANGLEIIDCSTGTALTMDPPYDAVWYADDEQGIIRYYVRDSDGGFMFARESDPQIPIWRHDEFTKFDHEGNPSGPVCVAWTEEKRRIRIIAKEQVTA